MELKSTIAAHNRYQDSMVQAFDQHLREIVLRAQGRVISRLQSKLSISQDKFTLYPTNGGVIESTASNMRVLRSAGKMFMEELDRAGYPRLVDAFVGEFRGTLPFLQDTLQFLGDQVGQKWGTDLGFTARDLSLLGGVQVNTVAALSGAIESVAGAAVTRGLFGVAGLRFGSLVEMLTERFETSIGRARTIADSGMSIWYRTASERSFAIITKDLPEQVLRYVYQGPRDLLERPFCRHLTDVDKEYTREQIDQMNNGQFPVGSCFTTAGGWNCRHGFYLSTRALVLPIGEAA